VTICEAGAFRGSCCWTSDMLVEHMAPEIAAASRHHFSRLFSEKLERCKVGRSDADMRAKRRTFWETK
jgi:hypothetical protein